MPAPALHIPDSIEQPESSDELSGQAPHIPESLATSSKGSSFKAQSESSTIVHETIPFEEYAVQVKALCHSLWSFPGKYFRSERSLSVSASRYLDSFLPTKLVSFLWRLPASKTFTIEHLAGGSFNRITGIKFDSGDALEPTRLILRVPRVEWASRPDRDVACLRYIRQHSKIPVAEVRACDFTSQNPLKSPYMIQDRLPGINLDRAIREGLNTEQLCSIARDIGRTMLAFQDLTNPTPGLIESCTAENGSSTFFVCPFDIKLPHDMQWKQKAAAADNNTIILKSYGKSTLHFLATQFGRWRADELQRDPESILYWDFMHRLTDAASQMDRIFCLGENENCLAHLDFAPRNIMVEIDEDDAIHLNGVLDWDSAAFAPKFVSCAPPWWLWQDEDDPLDVQDQDESKSDQEPASEQNRAIKQAFEETVGEEFLKYAYQDRFRLARKIFRIAIQGNNSNEHLRAIEEFLEEWEEFYRAEVAEVEAMLAEESLSEE
ncbi:hypothetical protein MMC28_005413 [Mycoblastus sanguinarius]|nr:hypothetical protein [Mycoblastus sanguinarius]